MRRLLVVAALVLAGLFAPGTPAPQAAPALAAPAAQVGCPGLILWSQARQCVGQTLWVAGTTVDTLYAYWVAGTPTFLNLGLPYPNPGRFTVLIWGEDRWKFGSPPPEVKYLWRNTCVYGTITLYAGAPQIVVQEPWQLMICE